MKALKNSLRQSYLLFFATLCFSISGLTQQTVTPTETKKHRDGLPQGFPRERVIIDASTSPWRRIGNLSIAGRKFCTASLISDTIVITAAHCLWNTERNDWYPPEFIHFLAGYQQEDYVSHSKAKRLHPNPQYRHQLSVDPKQLQQDWALLELEQPLGILVGYFNLKFFNPAQQQQVQKDLQAVALAGYRRDTKEALSLDASCHLEPTAAQLPPAFLSNNCHGLSGDSGGPLLMFDSGEWQLIGVHAGRVTDNRQRTQALAIPVSEFYDQLIALLSQTSSSL